MRSFTESLVSSWNTEFIMRVWLACHRSLNHVFPSAQTWAGVLSLEALNFDRNWKTDPRRRRGWSQGRQRLFSFSFLSKGLCGLQAWGKQTSRNYDVQSCQCGTGTWNDSTGPCALRHGIQNSTEAILACHPALSTEWVDWVAKWCERWCKRTGCIQKREKWFSSPDAHARNFCFLFFFSLTNFKLKLSILWARLPSHCQAPENVKA